MNTDELINKLFEILNKTIKSTDLTTRTIELLTELLEVLKIIKNCTNCKNKIEKKQHLNELNELINEIKNSLDELEFEEEEGEKYLILDKLNNSLIHIGDELNKKEALCKGCEKEIEKLTKKCGNEKMAEFLYQCKLNSKNRDRYIQWIPFNEFKNIEYLAKGDFGEIYKATWIYCYYYYKKEDVVLKRIYNSNDKISDTLKEVKKKVYY